jgi:ssDNA-binding replication factor A large subunit
MKVKEGREVKERRTGRKGRNKWKERKERKKERKKVFDADPFDVALIMLQNAPINSSRSLVWRCADRRQVYCADDPDTWR